MTSSLKPLEGSFPFQISADDFKQWGYQLLLLLAGVVVTFLLQTVLPNLEVTSQVGLLIIGTVTAALQLIDKWLRDTRPKIEKQQLPYREYLRTR